MFMKIAILQLWEIFTSDKQIQSDGCSIHIDEKSLNDFLTNYQTEENERKVGIHCEVEIPKSIFKVLSIDKSIRLSEIEMNNLIGLKEILPL